MSEREAFENKFPKPKDVYWCKNLNDYDYIDRGMGNPHAYNHLVSYRLAWKSWQASVSRYAEGPGDYKMSTQSFDEWFKARHTKTGIYKDALSGDGDATYIRHEMRKAYLKGAASRQAEVDALRHVLNSSGTTENPEP